MFYVDSQKGSAWQKETREETKTLRRKLKHQGGNYTTKEETIPPRRKLKHQGGNYTTKQETKTHRRRDNQEMPKEQKLIPKKKNDGDAPPPYR